jgi:hypothetical protein
MAVETLRRRIRVELDRRVAALPAALARFRDAAQGPRFSVHRTQVEAIEVMIAALVERLEGHLPALVDPGLADGVFADRVVALQQELAAVFELWCVFEGLLVRRWPTELAPWLDAADPIAADGYQELWRVVSNLGVPARSRREPPLVCFEGEPSPLALGRADGVEALGRPLDRYGRHKLPIPLVLLPADYAGCCWLLTAIHHELGHILDEDLRLSRELRGPLLHRTDGVVPGVRQEVWQGWTEEILADTIALLLGGAGFAATLASQVLALGPAARYDEQVPHDPHPHPRLRGAFAEKLLARLAEKDAAMSQELAAPAWVEPFLADVPAVVDAVLDARLDTLGGHTLAELGRGLANTAADVQRLDHYLRTGLQRPELAKFPYRAVPVAAQLAVAGAEGSAEDIQRRAAEVIAAIHRPAFLDVDALTTARKVMYRALVADIDFTRPLRAQGDL